MDRTIMKDPDETIRDMAAAIAAARPDTPQESGMKDPFEMGFDEALPQLNDKKDPFEMGFDE